MAHQNGRIFIDTTTTPNKGVEIADLQQVLGRGTGDLGLLCSDQEWYLLPYQRIEYLESAGTQYIDTLLVPQADDVVEITFQYVDAQSTIVLGCRNSTSSGKFTIGSGAANTQIYAALGTAENPKIADFDTNTHTVILNAGMGVASIDGSTGVSVGTFSANALNIYLFACNQNGGVSYQSRVRIMSVKIGRRAHFVPVRVGNVGYMYDLVSGQLFGNSGSGAFVLGDDVDSHILRPVNRINKWAKYKPVRQSGLDFASQRNDDFTWKSTAVWWKAYNGQCGLSFTTFSQLYVSNDPFNVNSFLRKLIDGDLPWAYEPPTGGINQYPFRMFDFLQYDHLAPKPVAGVNDIIRLYDGGKLTVQLDMSRAGESLGIQLPDITVNNSQLGNFYLGVLIYLSASTGYYMFAFSEDTIGNGADSVEFTGMTSYSGQRPMIVPFLASARAAQGTSPGSGIFLSCDVEPQEIQIRPEPSTTLTIDAQWKYGYGGLVSYDIRILNDTGAQISVNNMEVGLYDGIPNQGGVRIDYDTIADFVIAVGGTKDIKGTVDSSGYYDSSKTYYVRVTSDNPSVNGYVPVEAPRNPLIP